MSQPSFCTVINCMDGRVQEPVIAWMKRRFEAENVDSVTAAGPDGILAGGPEGTIAALKERVLISVNNHGSRVLALVGHHDCAGNPVSKAEHLAHLQQGLSVIEGWMLPVKRFALWLGPDWAVEDVTEDLAKLPPPG